MAINTEHLQRCILTLELSLSKLKDADKESIDYEVFRNAVIKGYELSLEFTGKLLKKAITPYFASHKAADTLTFKDIFRHAAKHDFLTPTEVKNWFEYRDNRNSTAHDYGEIFAEETLKLIYRFLNDVKKLEQTIQNVSA